nr:NADH dehydrogenase subunit 6 [Kaukania anser]
MKMIVMKFMFIVSVMMPLIKNPMSMGLLLLIQTFMTIIFMNKVLITSWFPMVTFLMMIGGLLIIFSYISSIASNEKFKIKFNLTFIFIILILIADEMILMNQIDEIQSMNFSSELNFSLTKIYNLKSMYITIFLVIYLLITMISVSKMVKHHEGPLRSF